MGYGRNLVLGLWEKDVQHLLMMTDCGISEEASGGEPARASLVREIYRFLDYHVSVVSKPHILFIRKCCNDFFMQTIDGAVTCTCILLYVFQRHSALAIMSVNFCPWRSARNCRLVVNNSPGQAPCLIVFILLMA